MKAKSPGQLLRILWRTPRKFGQHNCPLMAAGMSFFAIFMSSGFLKPDTCNAAF